jgi:hypothetical protein
MEARLTGPKRIGLFGHRNVGKTTLLAVFYRQAANGRVPGLRLAAVDPHSAEYLAEKIAYIESGEATAGTLAETALNLRLYHGPARHDLIVKDYQGEHITLGSDEPIQEFFADCDAVFLCLDPEGTASSAERTRRQQEIEVLLERYIERSDDQVADRPVALLLTKFDRVLAAAGSADLSTDDLAGRFVERLVDERYGMTRHALRRHAPGGAIFAVSSFGPGASGHRPPAVLQPLGLEGPLAWLAEQIEERDRVQIEEIWKLAADDPPRLRRCLDVYQKRYPRSNGSYEFAERLQALERKRRGRRIVRGVAAVGLVVAATAGYDAYGFRAAVGFEQGNAAPAIAERWRRVIERHPTMPLFWPGLARRARLKEAEWTVKAADVQVANGNDAPDLSATLSQIKDRAPQLAPEVRKVEQAREMIRHDERWKAVQGEALSLAAIDAPDKPLAAIDAFLREFPGTPRRADALALAATLKKELAARETAAEKLLVDDLARAESLPNADLADLADRARRFLKDHPDSALRPEVRRRLDGYIAGIDERDIERARAFSRKNPTSFALRVERYQDYLKAHRGGGGYLGEAAEAKERILAEWDTHAYRSAYDYSLAHPDDVAEVARRLREYQRDHPSGRFVADAKGYLDWWDKVTVPGKYRVTLRRGEVEPGVGKYLSGAGPDLGVVVEVGGEVYGPSPVISNTRRPIWDYTFPRPITWKLGDPVSVKIIDYDWSASDVYTLNSPQGDPLAMRLLSGTIKPAKGGRTSLVFTSDFAIPKLPQPD